MTSNYPNPQLALYTNNNNKYFNNNNNNANNRVISMKSSKEIIENSVKSTLSSEINKKKYTGIKQRNTTQS